MIQQLKVREGNTGILYITDESGKRERYIPNYNLDEAIALTLRILNLKTRDGKKLTEAFQYDGFNWASIIISDLYWQLVYPYILYKDLLEEIYAKKPELKFVNKLGRFWSAYTTMLGKKQSEKIFKDFLRKMPAVRSYLNYFISYNNRRHAKRDLVFDVMHENNFRTTQIEKSLTELAIDWVPAKGLLYHNLLKGNLGGIVKNYVHKGNNIFNYQYNLSGFENDALLNQYVVNTLKKIETRISSAIFSYDKHKFVMAMKHPKVLLSMDEANSHVFPLLYACKKMGIPTIGYQHGLYSKRHFAYSQCGLDNFQFDWFDTILVWGDYWGEKLRENENLRTTQVRTFVNKHKPFDYVDLGNKDNRKESLNILFPYEFLSNSYKVGKYMIKLLELGHKIYFKPRTDEKREDQIAAYHIDEMYRQKVKIIEKIDCNILGKMDAIMGTQTTYLYELLPYRIPIFIPETEFQLIDDMINEDMAERITYNELNDLPEKVNNYKYKGKEPEYYFASGDLKEKLGSFLEPFLT